MQSTGLSLLFAITLTIVGGGDAFGDTEFIPKLKIGLTEDGRIWIGTEEISLKQFSAFASAVAEINPKTRLNLRANKEVDTTHIKMVVTAWGEAGMTDVIFGSLTVDPRKPQR